MARVATHFVVTGVVGNDEGAVFIEAQGEPEEVGAFIDRVLATLPPVARLFNMTASGIEIAKDECGFEIARSRRAGGARSPVPTDLAVCADCLGELRDPSNRRYRYAFITCTNCGPRFTITRDLPYDRESTTMDTFEMCSACASEYRDVSDRRFHAQPISCYGCGPSLWLVQEGADDVAPPAGARRPEAQEATLALAGDLLAEGRILAVKGIGGFHLMCDARNVEAVRRLRDRKVRPEKPLAVMARDLSVASGLATFSQAQLAALTGAARPIVVVPKGPTYDLADEVAPGVRDVGLMLPYSPVHHLLLEASGRDLVATSGNLSEEPLCYDNPDAIARLGRIADAFLLHDREIHVPAEDSIVMARRDGAVLPVRRSRGFVPDPVALPHVAMEDSVLAVGGELKSAFALTTGGLTYASTHLGDMGSAAAQRALDASVAQAVRINRAEPNVIAHDLHSGYASTAWARARASAIPGSRLVPVQHHLAHALTLLAEHPEALGGAIVATMDGTGLGLDGTIWGGEVLHVRADAPSLASWSRVWHLPSIPLVGGDSAVRRPWRVARALGRAWGLDVDRMPLPAHTSATETAAVDSVLRSGIGVAQTSSAGRLFDAAAAIIGVRLETSYEAQAAAELESIATTWLELATSQEIAEDTEWARGLARHDDPTESIRLLMGSLLDEPRDAGRRAARFHRAFAGIVAQVLRRAARSHGVEFVGLTGGVAVNRLLELFFQETFGGTGLTLLTHSVFPPNDGGISVGQTLAAFLGLGEPEAAW